MRKIKIYAAGSDGIKEIMSTATTWGQLKSEIQANQDTSYLLANEMTVRVKETRNNLEDSNAILPTGEFTIFLSASKVKSGKNKMLGIFDGEKMIIGNDYNFYGIYQPYTKLWIWASSIPGVDSTIIKNIKKLKSYDYLFDSDINLKINFYYQLLTQDVLYISDEKMLYWINELFLYLSEDLYYFNPINSDNNIQFLTLIKIKEKYV